MISKRTLESGARESIGKECPKGARPNDAKLRQGLRVQLYWHPELE